MHGTLRSNQRGSVLKFLAVRAFLSAGFLMAVAADPALGGSGQKQPATSDSLSLHLHSLIEKLYATPGDAPAPASRRAPVRFQGISWLSPNGRPAGSSEIAVELGARIETALRADRVVLGPGEATGSKGIVGSILRGTVEVLSGGARVSLGLFEAVTGKRVSESSEFLRAGILGNAAALAGAPPGRDGATALAEIIHNAVAGARSDFQLRVWTDRGEFAAYHDGEPLSIYVESESDCSLRIYQMSWSEQKLKLIFPSMQDQNSRLTKGTVRKIPAGNDQFLFEVAPPHGVDAILVVASSDGFNEAPGGARRLSEDALAPSAVPSGSADEASLDEETVTAVAAKGLIVRRRDPEATPTSSGPIGEAAPAPSQTPEPVGGARMARAVCFFTTLGKQGRP